MLLSLASNHNKCRGWVSVQFLFIHVFQISIDAQLLKYLNNLLSDKDSPYCECNACHYAATSAVLTAAAL